MNLKNTFYILTCITFIMVIGAGTYEHFAIWPNAYAAPPKSLSMFQGEYALNSGTFWMLIHPINLVFFIITIFLNWKTSRKLYPLISLGIYFVILVITALYFVPELMEITGTTYADTIDPDLQSRGALWINLSLLRALILVGTAIYLLLGLTKSENQV